MALQFFIPSILTYILDIIITSCNGGKSYSGELMIVVESKNTPNSFNARASFIIILFLLTYCLLFPIIRCYSI